MGFSKLLSPGRKSWPKSHPHSYHFMFLVSLNEFGMTKNIARTSVLLPWSDMIFKIREDSNMKGFLQHSLVMQLGTTTHMESLFYQTRWIDCWLDGETLWWIGICCLPILWHETESQSRSCKPCKSSFSCNVFYVHMRGALVYCIQAVEYNEVC